MIRHVSVFTFKEGADPAQLVKALDLVRERVPGALSATYGPDAGLRQGNDAFATTFDFADEGTYRAWDTHPEHDRIRRELVLPIVASLHRCQFRVKDAND